MLPTQLIDVRRGHGGELTPRYLTDRDFAWVRAVQDSFAAAVGAPRHALEARLRATPPDAARPRARKAVEHLLMRLHGFELRAPLAPRQVRQLVFDLAGSQPAAGADAIWEQAAALLGVPPDAARASLYADLPGSRVLCEPGAALSTPDLIERYNLTLAQALLFRAERLTVALRGQVKQVLRFARLQHLLVRARRDPADPSGALLDVSGPLSLFRFTTKYGRAMARWLPALTRVAEWRLEARCVLDNTPGTFRASHHDPIGTTHRPERRFDSQLEARFFEAMMRLAPEWEILREASPSTVGQRIVCPDFTFVNRQRRIVVPIELVGYWTPPYLADKLATVRALRARGERWLLCVDRRLAAGDALPREAGTAPPDVIFFDRHVKAQDVLRYLDAIPLAP